jgi:exodeoxyribonuclease VII small subunit
VASKAQDETASLPFEEALKRLEEIVARLEGGQVGLDESIKLYESGEKLKARCEALLKDAEARIEKIRLGANGQPAGVEKLDE